MAIFWRVILANDQMGALGGQVVLVDAAQLGRFGSDISLESRQLAGNLKFGKSRYTGESAGMSIDG